MVNEDEIIIKRFEDSFKSDKKSSLLSCLWCSWSIATENKTPKQISMYLLQKEE